MIVVGYHLFIFSDFTLDVGAKYIMGWSCLGFSTFVIIVNIVFMLVMNVSKMARRCKLKVLRRKAIREANRRKLSKQHHLLFNRLSKGLDIEKIKSSDLPIIKEEPLAYSESC